MSSGLHFICYSRADTMFAKKLVAHLLANRLNVWIDQTDIPKGAFWDREIEKALNNSDTVIVLLSPAANDSENVFNEIDFALRKKKRVIPLIIKDCEPPLRLSRCQQVNFLAGFEAGADELVEALRHNNKSKLDTKKPDPLPEKLTPPKGAPSIPAWRITGSLYNDPEGSNYFTADKIQQEYFKLPKQTNEIKPDSTGAPAQPHTPKPGETASVPRISPFLSSQPVKVAPRIQRNDPCPCGSGKKYKNCHGQNE